MFLDDMASNLMDAIGKVKGKVKDKVKERCDGFSVRQYVNNSVPRILVSGLIRAVNDNCKNFRYNSIDFIAEKLGDKYCFSGIAWKLVDYRGQKANPDEKIEVDEEHSNTSPLYKIVTDESDEKLYLKKASVYYALLPKSISSKLAMFFVFYVLKPDKQEQTPA